MSNIKACKKHIDNPAICYASCPGCEMERLRSERDVARRDYEVMNKFREAAEQERDAALEREQALAAHAERLDNELQEKALTDDGVLSDAYWSCADKITPWLGEETGPDTLINSVCGSLEFLIEQWREKKEIEQERDKRDLIKRAEALESFREQYELHCDVPDFILGDLEETAADLRQRAQELDE